MQKQRKKTKKADDSVSKHRKGIFLHFFTTKDSTDFSIKTMSCSFLPFKNSILQNFLYWRHNSIGLTIYLTTPWKEKERLCSPSQQYSTTPQNFSTADSARSPTMIWRIRHRTGSRKNSASKQKVPAGRLISILTSRKDIVSTGFAGPFSTCRTRVLQVLLWTRRSQNGLRLFSWIFWFSRSCKPSGFFLPNILSSKQLHRQRIRTGGSRPARRHTFCPNGDKKYAKTAFLLAEGISSAGFPWRQEPAVMGIRPCVKGPDLSVLHTGEKPQNMTTFTILHNRRGSKEPRVVRGKRSHIILWSRLDWSCRPDEPDMPSAALSFLLLRFLCHYKENDVAVGQPRRFCF